jgi:hypothetical protein
MVRNPVTPLRMNCELADGFVESKAPYACALVRGGRLFSKAAGCSTDPDPSITALVRRCYYYPRPIE